MSDGLKFGQGMSNTRSAANASILQNALNTGSAANQGPDVGEEAAIDQAPGGAFMVTGVSRESDERKITNVYCCLPTQNLKIGRWQFTSGYVELTQEENLEFVADMKRQPAHVIGGIRVSEGRPRLTQTLIEAMSGENSASVPVMADDLIDQS